MVKTFDEMQKTSNANVDATMHSFEGVTKATQAIAIEIADYTKRSFESGTKTMENLVGANELLALLRPNTATAGEYPCRSGPAVVGPPTHDGGIAVGGQRH